MSDEGEKRKSVFLVDDDSFLLDMYSLKFEKNGFDVNSFTDPSQCLDKLREGMAPDIIISDLVMPGIDGWSFIKEIREKGLSPHSTVIVLSNQNQQADLDNSKKYDVDGYIIKALATPTEVVNKVEQIFQSSKK